MASMIVRSYGFNPANPGTHHSRLASGNPNTSPSSPPPNSDPEDAADMSIKEGAWVGAVIGLSLGTAGGAYVGKFSAVAGGAYAGMKLGSRFGLPGQIGGAVAGAALTYLEEEKLGVGKTVGGLVGLASGAVVGGAVGSIVAIFI